MTLQDLIEQIKKKQSFLTIGLDVDLEKIPEHLLEESDPIFAFNKQIVDATYDIAVSYKPNIAFYEYYGAEGWKSLQKTMDYINEKYPKIFTIADAKRGDIGNTAKRYATIFFEKLGFNSATVSPYMGRDAIEPFLDFKNKYTILLALTSNKGASNFQQKKLFGGHCLYQEVLKQSLTWQQNENLMYVVGGTQEKYLQNIRTIIPNHFLLVPGVGAQGGSLQKICKYGLNKNIGLLINSSRGIIYADNSKNFAKVARKKALEIQKQMKNALNRL